MLDTGAWGWTRHPCCLLALTCRNVRDATVHSRSVKRHADGKRLVHDEFQSIEHALVPYRMPPSDAMLLRPPWSCLPLFSNMDFDILGRAARAWI